MKVQKSLKPGVAIFLCAGIFFLSGAALDAKEAVLPVVLNKSKALVSIQSMKKINATGIGKDPDDQRYALLMTGSRYKPTAYGRSGSGVIIDPKGVIVANYHTVSHASRISVTLSDGTQTPARLIYVLPESDLAFLSIVPPFRLPYVPLANSDMVSVGATVYMIGRALGHNGSVYGGKISGVFTQPLRRDPPLSLLEVNFGFHLFFGDSGSPLLNRNGYLLGIVSGGRREGDKAALVVASNVIRDAYRQIPFGV
ncbi:MAG TPA: S1C family serine protease [Candidatus Omnitrophota bacterium]|nr:S1C family serine protease [Candidatus Omnitrophota bacterium]